MAVLEDERRREAGQIIRAARERRGITQEQVIEHTTIPTKSMLSDYENGKTGISRSKHLPSLIEYLGLSQEEIRKLNPTMVVNMQPGNEEPASVGGGGISNRARRPVRTAGKITGDMTIHPPPEGHLNEVLYDKKSASWLVVTEASGRYWIWFVENVPTGHRVLGTLQEWRLVSQPKSALPH